MKVMDSFVKESIMLAGWPSSQAVGIRSLENSSRAASWAR
jgi:hypothetical protein